MLAGADTRSMVRWLRPTCVAMATVLQPWRCKVQTCVIDGLPARGALGRAGLLGRRGRRWWHGDRAASHQAGHGLLARRRVDGVERPAMRREHLGEDFGEVL